MEKKVAVYVRVSTDKEQTTQMQKIEIDRYCEYKGVKGYELFDDEGWTGRNSNRPALKELMKAVRLNQISTVIVWKLDRFARSLHDLIELLGVLKKHQVTFISVVDGIDLSTPHGVFFMHIMGAMAELESGLISYRTRTKMKQIKENGGKTKTGRPIGNPNWIKSKVKIEDRLTMKDLRSMGYSFQEISSHMRSRHNLKISRSGVYKLLNNQV